MKLRLREHVTAKDLAPLGFYPVSECIMLYEVAKPKKGITTYVSANLMDNTLDISTTVDLTPPESLYTNLGDGFEQRSYDADSVDDIICFDFTTDIPDILFTMLMTDLIDTVFGSGANGRP